ncbi:hypothetical protein DY000_02048807 [Brassica cretica]|uniref:Uncharacterized protein n=1 Tax=Brassica cretica TaxID=69181 RepID=A0ABQ7EYC2_BRACR|nr:hypothetical protein DY000_02048807 [Brassica cretica]
MFSGSKLCGVSSFHFAGSGGCGRSNKVLVSFGKEEQRRLLPVVGEMVADLRQVLVAQYPYPGAISIFVYRNFWSRDSVRV